MRKRLIFLSQNYILNKVCHVKYVEDAPMTAKAAGNKEQLLNRMDARPLGAQLKSIIRAKITSGEWAPNSMIPSENKLSEIYGISRMTVRGVITQFVSQGFLYRIPGKGTFVCDSKFEIRSLQYAGIRGQLEAQGHSVDTVLIGCERLPAEEFEAQKLGIPVGEEIYIIKRTRAANGVVISYHESYVPAALCPDLEKRDLQNEQLCKIMSTDYLLQRGRVVETLESFSADRVRAGYLNVKAGFSLILLQDQLYTPDNIIYEYSRVYFRGDKTKLRIEFSTELPSSND